MNKQFPVMLAGVPILLIIFSCGGRQYRSPSTAMEKTIMLGETFTVTKTDSFANGDIAVFEHLNYDYSAEPDENGYYPQVWGKWFYRLIASSGDVIQLKDGDVFVNRQHIPFPPKALLLYKVFAKQPIIELEESQDLVEQPVRMGDTLIYTIPLTTEQFAELSQKTALILSIKRTLQDLSVHADTAFSRASAEGVWSTDNYGPLHIPSPGDTIVVDSINYKLFHNIPGIHFGKNMITENLYFLMGDNRYGSNDSRFIGLIPHSKMVGVVK